MLVTTQSFLPANRCATRNCSSRALNLPRDLKPAAAECFPKVLAASGVLRQGLPTALCHSGRCSEGLGSVLHQLVLKVLFHELDDGTAKKLFSIYLLFFSCVCELAGLLVDKDRKKKKKKMKSLKFRRNMCQTWHFGRKNEAQERAILWKSMQDLLCTVNSAGVK